VLASGVSRIGRVGVDLVAVQCLRHHLNGQLAPLGQAVQAGHDDVAGIHFEVST
jgi:hypothetical protein